MTVSTRALKREIAKRVAAATAAQQRPVFDPDTFFFGKQGEFFNITAKNRAKVACCSRRAGKTIGIIGDAIKLLRSEKSVRVLYITLTRENCLEIIWPDLMAYIEKYEIPVKINQVRLQVTFLETGSIFSCAGAKDEREIGKFRGRKLRRIYVDEAQNFPSYIAKMIREDLMPTLRDLRGDIVVTGTPGPIRRGFFYDIIHGGTWDARTWTAFDNPHMHDPDNGKDLEITLAEEREVNNIDKNDPAYIRETYGIWHEDSNALVFRFDESKNVVHTAPQVGMSYIFGIDIGYDDSDAIAVLGYDNRDGVVYLVEEKVTAKQDISSLVAQIKGLQQKYDPVKMVIDGGALGKKINAEILSRHNLVIEAADKHRKIEFIELLNDDLRNGKFKTVRIKNVDKKGQTTWLPTRFEDDCYQVQWDRSNPDPTKVRISNTFHSDSCFIAGTLVQTYQGSIAIEKVKAGDLVLTRQGYKTVQWSAKTGENKQVTKLVFSNGAEVVCTPEHPIFTENRGFVAASDLTGLDMFNTIGLWEKINVAELPEKQLFSTGPSFTDTKILSMSISDGTILATIKTKKQCFIEQFGSIAMGLSQKAVSFITKIATQKTTPLKTLNVLPQNNTSGNTKPHSYQETGLEHSLSAKRKQKNGTLVLRAGLGIKNMQQAGLKKIVKKLNGPALFAVQSFLAIYYQKHQNQSVHKNASQRIEETAVLITSKEFVSGVKNLSEPTSMEKPDSAVVLVTQETLTQRHDVYNLSVEGLPEFYANGILVHNCDATLYAWRECRHYFQDSATPKLARNSQEYADAQYDAMVDAHENRTAGDNDDTIDQDEMNSLYDDN